MAFENSNIRDEEKVGKSAEIVHILVGRCAGIEEKYVGRFAISNCNRRYLRQKYHVYHAET